MLSVEQRRRQELISNRAGMRNIAWLVGRATRITPGGGFIQQSSNLNHMIPFVLAEGNILPRWVKDGAMVKIRARLKGDVGAKDEPIVVATAFDFEEPNILDLPPREKWTVPTRPGVPNDPSQPEGLPTSEQRGDSTRMSRLPDTANMAEVAGYIGAMVLEAPNTRQGPEGVDVSKGCLIIGIRQTADPSDLIPVRVYGPQVTALRRRLEIGQELKVKGRLRVRLQNTGEPAGEDGIIPAHKWLYLHADLNSFTRPAMGHDIRDEPAWVEAMRLEYEARRQERRRAAEAAQAAKAAKPADASSSAPTAGDGHQAGQQTKPSPVAPTKVDQAALASLGLGTEATK